MSAAAAAPVLALPGVMEGMDGPVTAQPMRSGPALALAPAPARAMTMNRGAVAVYEVEVWRVSCSVGVGSRYWSAFQGTLGSTWVTT